MIQTSRCPTLPSSISPIAHIGDGDEVNNIDFPAMGLSLTKSPVANLIKSTYQACYFLCFIEERLLNPR